MNVKMFSIISALSIGLSLSTAQAGMNAKETLRDMQESATMAGDQASELITFSSNMRVSPEAHLEKLMALKGELNRTGEEIKTLETERGSLEPWERQALDKAVPLLADAAANTEKAIEYFNDNKPELWRPDYRAYAEHIWRDSEDAARELKTYLSYAQTRQREVRLEQNLGISGR